GEVLRRPDPAVLYLIQDPLVVALADVATQERLQALGIGPREQRRLVGVRRVERRGQLRRVLEVVQVGARTQQNALVVNGLVVVADEPGVAPGLIGRMLDLPPRAADEGLDDAVLR